MSNRHKEYLESFCNEMPPRPMGTETEFSLQNKAPLPALGSNPAINKYLIHPSHNANRRWTKGGGLIYLDNNRTAYSGNPVASADAVLEYATPESTSAKLTANHEKSGEHLATLLGQHYLPGIKYPVYKRTAYARVASGGKNIMAPRSLGSHENYTTPAFDIPNVSHQAIKNQILSYLTTRPVWAGAGIVSPHGYQLYQKYEGMDFNNGASSTKHGSKESIRINAHDRGAPSVEIRSGDSNMSLWAIRTKLAYTSLILRLIEHGEFPDSALINQTLHNQMACQASRAPGESLGADMPSPIEHQLLLARHAMNFALLNNARDEEFTAAADVETACLQALDWVADPDALEPLADRVDWAAKLTILQGRLGKNATLNTTNVDAVQLDLLWESLGDRPVSDTYFSKSGNVANPADVKRALYQPPAGRASQRVATVKAADPNTIKTIGWDGIIYKDSQYDQKFELTI